MLTVIWDRIFSCIQILVTYINSILIKLHTGKKSNENDHKALVYKVLFRYKPSARLDFSCKDDFISIFLYSCDPNILLDDNITLYSIKSTEAVLVDCGNKDVFDSKYHAFAYNAQFALARNVICIPLKSFYKVTSIITLPSIPMIHLANHGRCGSTLLTKLFEAIPEALSISETNALTDIATLSHKGLINRQELKKMCRSVIMCTVKHCHYRKSSILWLKFQNIILYITDLMMESVPEIKTIYMYRQPVSFVRSYEKLLFSNNWEPLNVEMALFWSGVGYNDILKEYPRYDYKQIEKLSSFSRFGLIWITSYAAFVNLLNKGFNLKSLKFEDFLSDPRGTLLKIFKYAEVDEDLMPNVDAVMSRDSQAGTEYSSRNADKKMMDASLTPITKTLIEELDILCCQFDCPLFWNNIKLDKSIV